MSQSNSPQSLATARMGGVLAALGMAMASAPAWAACQISLGYSPASSPVPSLTVASVAVLATALGALAWSRRSGMGSAGRKLLLLAVCGSAGLLAVQTGDGLIQTVRAAGPYEFNNPVGGTVSDNAMPDGTTSVTVSNTSGVPVRIVSNSNANAPGSCQPGSVVAPGGSCTTNAVCTPPPGPGNQGSV